MIDTLKRCWSMLHRDEKRFFGRLALLSAFNAILEVVGAALIFSLVDSLQHESDQGSTAGDYVRDVFPDATAHGVVYILCAITAIFYLVKSLSGVTETYVRNRRINQSGATMNKRLLRAYLKAPLTFHHVNASADLVRTGFYSTDAMYRAAVVSGAQLLSELLAALTLLLVMVVASPLIAPLVLGVMGGVLVVSYRAFRRRLRAWGEATQKQYGECFNAMSESIRGYRDIRLHEADDHFLAGFSIERDQLARAWTSSDTASQSSRFLLETVFVLSVVVLVIGLVVSSGDSSKTTALLALYGYAGFRLMPSANRALQAIGYISTAAPAVELIQADLERLHVEESDAAEAAPVVEHRPNLELRTAIDVRGLTFTFPGSAEPALRHVDLRIARGESIGIVGSSGAGKSTFVDLLVGLLSPDAGTIEVDGQDISGRMAEWHHLLGYVSQATFLLDATLRQNIAFGIDEADIDDAIVAEAVHLAQLEPLVQHLPEGLETVVGENGVRLSGGQRQRIAIARALYSRPQLLVFDEATSALDNATEAELTAAIEQLAGERTVVIIAHRLSTVRHCDRIFLFRDGVVAESGTFDGLLETSEEFRQLSRLSNAEARRAEPDPEDASDVVSSVDEGDDVEVDVP